MHHQVREGDRPFRVVVVGGGVAGLVASKLLQQLGIDHVVLEKHREATPAAGAGISMWPHGLRILHQLGYLDAVKRASTPVKRFQCRASDGRLLHDNNLYTHVEENHGIGFFPLERREFLQILYDGLPDKSFVRTGAGVVDAVQFPDRVEVKLSNGEVEVGDIAIGCDGVHSVLRSAMWDHAGKSSPGLIKVKEKKTLETWWKTLFFVTPAIPELGTRDLLVTYNHGFTFLATSQPHAVYFFVIFRRDKPFTWPKRERYTEADALELADRVMDKPVTDQMVFSEVWKRRIRSGVISLEEGVLEHWHHGRIVLAGDAVHKVHPNMALGGNSAIEGVVSLVNHLNRTLERQRVRVAPDSRPSATALNAAFAAYQKQQRQRMQELMELSNMVAKMHTYTTPIHRFLADWVLPAVNDRLFANHVGTYIAASPRIEYLPLRGFTQGRIAWKEAEDEEVKEVKKVGNSGNERWNGVGEQGVVAVEAY